jgi:hypothetical protein
MHNIYRLFVVKPEGKPLFKKFWYRWVNNIKMYVREIRLESRDFTHLSRKWSSSRLF